MAMKRQCGECTLCCKLLAVVEIGKKAGVRCEHQQAHKGCKIYGQPDMPVSCRIWSCAWLIGEDTGPRPDRAHYVIDPLPDFITLQGDDNGDQNIPVVQVWIDPQHPDAHRDHGLRAFLARRGEHGMAALIRSDSKLAFALFPPAMSADGQWHELENRAAARPQHSAAEIGEVLAARGIDYKIVMER
jgi:hypothetical protein